MSINDFELIKEIGKGAFANVWLAHRKADKIFYAMKRINIKTATQKSKENALNEVRLLASVSHPNIIDYKESFFDEESMSLNIVMECADDGDLQAKIYKYKQARTWIPEKDIWSYLIQIVHGLKVLHDHKIMHRDLKTANIFIHKNGQVKLGDLNVSKELENGFLNTQTGTPYYASPEVWSEKPYDYKSDIWSLGCIIYELCCLKLPFRGKNIDQLFRCVLSGVYDPLPSHYSKELNGVISMMLKIDPTKRPNCDSLISNPIILNKITTQQPVVNNNEKTSLLEKIKWPVDDIRKLHNLLPKVRRYVKPTPVASATGEMKSLSKEKNNNKLKVDSKENYYNVLSEVNTKLYKSNPNEICVSKEPKIKVVNLLNKKAEEKLYVNKSSTKPRLSKSPVKLAERYNHLDKNKCGGGVLKVNKINPVNIQIFLNKYGYNNNKLQKVQK
jgi:NIMA (never in mitosis gene a)-related kinase